MGTAVGRIDEVVVDCRDPEKLATFWGLMFGVKPSLRDATWATVHDPGTGLVVAFQEVPEPKTGKNRLHIDVRVADLQQATAACVALGATAKGSIIEDAEGSFQVMLDPEGHEFCLVT
jgi:predicted enzyme related to lactoylglutathione lyase